MRALWLVVYAFVIGGMLAVVGFAAWLIVSGMANNLAPVLP